MTTTDRFVDAAGHVWEFRNDRGMYYLYHDNRVIGKSSVRFIIAERFFKFKKSLT